MSTAPPASWTCAFCGRTVPGRVDECYCGRTRPAVRAVTKRKTSSKRSSAAAVATLIVVAVAAWQLFNRWQPAQPVPRSAATDVTRTLALASATEPEASAPVSDDVLKTARAAVVLVESAQRRGTGFFSATNEITTTSAIVGQQKSVTVTFPDGHQIDAMVTAIADRPHLAQLKIGDASPSWLPPSPIRDARAGEQVVGLPSGRDSARGTVKGLRVEQGTEVFETALVLHAEDEGAPLVDRTGRVLAVVADRRAIAFDSARPYFRAVP